MKSRSLALGILLGITAVISLAVVYIDTTQNYWYVNGGFVKLIVSNQTQQAIMTVDTNTFAVGFNTNNSARSFVVQGRNPTNTATGNGTSANPTGTLLFSAGNGGDASTNGLAATGGASGQVIFQGGTGGSAINTTSNSTGGAGGTMNLTGGTGGGERAVATNAITGGNGATVILNGGSGGVPTFAATQTVAGAGGAITMQGGLGLTPAVGWSRRPSVGGTASLLAGDAGANAVRTNGANGGNAVITAGAAGGVATAPGTAGQAGNVTITAGAGALGDTNSNGGSVYVRGGNPGSTATPGNIYLARTSAGSARGGVVIGLGEFTVTNMIGGSASLDFPSTVAGAFSDLPITVTGTTSNGCSVVLGIPWEMAQLGGGFVHYTSNDTVYVRFLNNQPVTAIDPSPATVTAIVLKNQ